jgi:hypothetical protein
MGLNTMIFPTPIVTSLRRKRRRRSLSKNLGVPRRQARFSRKSPALTMTLTGEMLIR